MKLKITSEEKQALEKQHKRECDRRITDRIKALLLYVEGWSQIQIAQALRIHADAVHDRLEDYKKSKKLKPENGGSQSFLTQDQTHQLIQRLEAYTYDKASEICAYVKTTWGAAFSVSGMTKWLRHNNFSYKKPHADPAKADYEKQAEFIRYYENLLNALLKDEPVGFGNGVHPTMTTKIAYGWIRTGTDKPLLTTGSRTRLNLMSINLESMDVTIGSYETLDSQAMEGHFEKLKQKYPKAAKIHLILDQGRYNTSAAEKYGIVLHYLPLYSPNLNPIERLWKVMNEYARNNRFFHSAQEFRKAIWNFFDVTWPQIAHSMFNRISDNFQILKPVSSG